MDLVRSLEGAELPPGPLPLNVISMAAYANAREKGFYDDPPSVERRLLLMIEEITEANGELRAGHATDEVYYAPGKSKPEGFPIELADAVIRIADLCQYLGIDLEAAIRLKHAYNRTRPHKHGKLY